MHRECLPFEVFLLWSKAREKIRLFKPTLRDFLNIFSGKAVSVRGKWIFDMLIREDISFSTALNSIINFRGSIVFDMGVEGWEKVILSSVCLFKSL